MRRTILALTSGSSSLRACGGGAGESDATQTQVADEAAAKPDTGGVDSDLHRAHLAEGESGGPLLPNSSRSGLLLPRRGRALKTRVPDGHGSAVDLGLVPRKQADRLRGRGSAFLQLFAIDPSDAIHAPANEHQIVSQMIGPGEALRERLSGQPVFLVETHSSQPAGTHSMGSARHARNGRRELTRRR